MTPARAALPLALVACALACEGKRAVAPTAAAPAEHVEIGRSTHTVAPQPYDGAATPASGETASSPPNRSTRRPAVATTDRWSARSASAIRVPIR